MEDLNTVSILIQIVLAIVCGRVLEVERGKANQVTRLWTSVCIGLSLGIRFYFGTIIATVVIYLVISKFRVISNHFIHNDMWLRSYVEFQSINNLMDLCAFIENIKVFF